MVNETSIAGSAMLPEPPFKLGRYSINRIIGSGGMGIVYEGTYSTRAGMKNVAVKVLNPGTMEQDGSIEMFWHEARLSMMVDSPSFVRVLDFGSDRGLHYMVMELLDGASLSEILSVAGSPLPQPMAAFITYRVAQALAVIHGLRDGDRPLGVVHRDVSPQNIFLTREGRVVLMDLGIASFDGRRRITREHRVRGRLRYLAPERARDGRETTETDIYALGLVLWEMLTGRSRYDEGRADGFMDIAIGEYVSPSVYGIDLDPSLERIMKRMLHPDPQERCHDSRKLARHLGEWLGLWKLESGVGALGRMIHEGEAGLMESLPTRLEDPGTQAYFMGRAAPGRTLILEENVLTRVMERDELEAAHRRYSDTALLDVDHAKSRFTGITWFLAGVLSGAVVAGFGAMALLHLL